MVFESYPKNSSNRPSVCSPNNGGGKRYATGEVGTFNGEPTSGIEPAIDAGDNCAVHGDLTTDLDGLSRFIEIGSIPDTGSGSPPIVDMSAYEFIFQWFTPLILR
jgi:hypothetical protein